MKTFFDLQNLDEISEEQLVADVKQSKCLVTILDTETFRSPWVALENQTVVDHGIRIVIFFDGDKYAWNDLSFWLPSGSRTSRRFSRPRQLNTIEPTTGCRRRC